MSNLHLALLTTPLPDGVLRCGVCLRNCAIAPGQRGACRTRVNVEGSLYTLIYDRVSAANFDPIEKKPLYHFHPGTVVFSLGTVGCSFACPGCQNWTLSHTAAEMPVGQAFLPIRSGQNRLTPAQSVELALRQGAAGICWTYNDPAIWIEHTLEGARLAKERGLYTAYVTNGTATKAHLDLIGPYLDTYRVDIKAWSPQAYRALTGGFGAAGAIREHVHYAASHWGMHIECVTNVTPTLNDSDEELRPIAHWIAASLGPDTPWHVTRFHPCEELAGLPATPASTLDRAYDIGVAEGLRYIYVGNVAGDPRQHTHCPSCHKVVIHREGFSAVSLLVDGQCPNCRTAIVGRW